MKKITLSMIAMASVMMANGEENSLDSKNSFWDKVHVKGDLRLRHEEIERDDKTDKYRERYRLRYNLNVDFSDNFIFESALA